MARSSKAKVPVPESFSSVPEAADFWDTHDLADYPDMLKSVAAEIKVPRTPRYVPLERETAESITRISEKMHISVETLVNVWLKERILTASQKTSKARV